MKKRLLAILLSLCLLVGLFPTVAMATNEEPGGETPAVCAMLEGCVEDAHDEGCPLYVAPEEPKTPAPCDLTQGCTLEAGHEGDCALPEEGPTAEEQLAELIAALPDPEDIDPLDEEQVEEVNDLISAIYAFAEENGLDVEDNETINAVIEALYPSEPLADNDYIADYADQRTLQGAGTESDPYLISDADDLDKIRYYIVSTNEQDTVNDSNVTTTINSQIIVGYFQLTGDIDMSSVTSWTPIGMTEENEDVRYKTAFVGTFDGGDFTISNLTLNTEHQGIGLFTRVGEGGTVKNLTIDTCTAGDETTTTQEIGAICGTAWGATFSDITLKKITIKGGGYAGGLSGDIWSVDDTGTTVIDCSITDSSISGGAATGGLIGRTHDNDTLTGGTASNIEVTASGHSVGGLAGVLNGPCSDCHTENVTVTSTMNGTARAGGLFGMGYGALSNCSASGSASAGTSGQEAGGLGAYYTGEKIENCSADVTVDALWRVGGLIGFISKDGTEITNCHATGNVEITGSNTSNHMAGGLIGRTNENEITGCYATGNVTDQDTTVAAGTAVGIGGLIGVATDSTVSDCYATGNVKGATSTGGLVGRSASEVENCYATGAVSGSGETGGAIGHAASGTTIKSSYATGAVTGGSYTGGFVGLINAGATIESAAATGAVTSDSGEVGGFVGRTNGAPTIKNALAAGTVSGTTAGAFVGTAATTIKGIENCYATSTSSIPFTGASSGYYSPQNCFWAGNVTGMLSNNSTPNGSAWQTPDYYYAKLDLSNVTAVYGNKVELTLTQTDTIGSSVTDGTTPKHTLTVKTSPEGLVSVDADGSMTASAAGSGTLSLVMEVNGKDFVFGSANVTVDPMPITFGTSTGENPNGNIQYAFTGMAPEFSQFAAFYQAVKDENGAYAPGTNKIPLTEGTDIVFNYDAGAGAHDYDYLPINVTEAEYIEVTVKLVNPNYRFVTESNSNLSQTITEKVIVQADGKTEVPFISLPAAGESMTYEYTGSGLAPISNLTRISAGTIDKFTVHFHAWDDTEFTEAHLEGKSSDELTPAEVLNIAPKEPGVYLMIVDGVNENQYAYQSYIFTITKATVTITPNNKTAYVGDTLPALGENDYTVTGLVGDDTLTKAPTLAYESAPDMNTAGTYTIKASGAEVDDTHYTLVYQDGTLTVSRRSSGGGSSSAGDYTVSVDSGKNGKVTVSPSRADKGDTVTITVKPDKGYKLDELVVLDKNGDELKLTSKGDNKFTFKMPAGKVTVEASFVPEADPDIPDISFTDVPYGAYYYDAVLWAVSEGITSGTSATTFSPNASCTRAQMVTFLWRAAGSPKATGSNPFTDLTPSAYYYDAVLWAVSEGITAGTSATTFAPNATVTRGQTVTFLYRAAGAPAVSGASFDDVAADAYYADAVAWAVAEGITVGTGDNTFSPAADCTRGQIVTFLYRDMAK